MHYVVIRLLVKCFEQGKSAADSRNKTADKAEPNAHACAVVEFHKVFEVACKHKTRNKHEDSAYKSERNAELPRR